MPYTETKDERFENVRSGGRPYASQGKIFGTESRRRRRGEKAGNLLRSFPAEHRVTLDLEENLALIEPVADVPETGEHQHLMGNDA